MNKLLTACFVAVCMLLPVPAHAGMEEIQPHALVAAWQTVTKKISSDGKTIFVQDKAAALEVLTRLGITKITKDGVRAQKDGLIIIIRPGDEGSSEFYKLNVTEKNKPECTIVLKKCD